MKPFDLQRALAGDKVVTRDGHEVTQLTSFNCAGEVLAGVANGCLHTWYEGGKYTVEDKVSGFDLFMAPKTVKRWVNFYKNERATHYETENGAKAHADTFTAIAIAVPVEFEEGFGVDHE